MIWLLLACVGRSNNSVEALPLAQVHAQASARFTGLDHVELDLIRPWPGAPKIYVQAMLPDGEPGVFLVDTGAGISALSDARAEKLGLKVVDTGGVISGLGGSAPWRSAQVESIDLGGLVVQNVDLAIGIPGMPERAGAIPIDGILGNNVWGDLVLAVDYPADIIEIGLPGTVDVPRNAQPMMFDGAHAVIQVTLTAGEEDDDTLVRPILLEVDTGAVGILLSGTSGEGLEEVATEGEEPIFGLGASDRVPVSAFYQRTRRVPVQIAELGGEKVEDPGAARWINYEMGPNVGPPALLGLAGHYLLEDHRAVFDFPNQQFALGPSTHDARQVDGHQLLLDQDLERFGDDAPERGLVRGRYRTALDELDAAIADLDAYVATGADDAGEALVLKARIRRAQGDLDGYHAVVEAVDPGVLVDEGELAATVNSLILRGDTDGAVELALSGIDARPDESLGYLALADARLAEGDPIAARQALNDAGLYAGNPDAYLKRRARVALAEGDDYAALALLRRQLSLYPSDGEAIWFYGMQVAAGQEMAATFEQDAARAMDRLHPEGRPLDFWVASLRLVGSGVDTADLVTQGIARDCEDGRDEADMKNCTAWYQTMGGNADDDALAGIQAALADDPHRPDYLDTLAMVYLVRGELDLAAQASLDAAMLSPDSFYHLWQAERIAELAAAAQ